MRSTLPHLPGRELDADWELCDSCDSWESSLQLRPVDMSTDAHAFTPRSRTTSQGEAASVPAARRAGYVDHGRLRCRRPGGGRPGHAVGRRGGKAAGHVPGGDLLTMD